MSTTCPESQRRRHGGFSIVAAIFILVVLAALAAFVVSVSTTQNITFAQDVQSARAYQAARAGIEWGIARWLAAVPTCDSGTLAGLDGGFSVAVTGTPISDSGKNFCSIQATATTGGSAGNLGYIERQLRAVVEGS